MGGTRAAVAGRKAAQKAQKGRVVKRGDAGGLELTVKARRGVGGREQVGVVGGLTLERERVAAEGGAQEAERREQAEVDEAEHEPGKRGDERAGGGVEAALKWGVTERAQPGECGKGDGDDKGGECGGVAGVDGEQQSGKRGGTGLEPGAGGGGGGHAGQGWRRSAERQ